MTNELSGLFTDTELATIVDLIRRGQATTRSELGRKSGLGRNSVSAHLARAVELGLVAQDGHAPSNGGRSPHAWRFTKEAGTVLTATIAVHSFRLASTDLLGNPIDVVKGEWEIQEGPHATLTMIAEHLSDMGRRAASPVWGVGISLPGPIDHASGTPVSPPIMAGWDGFDVRGFLAARLNVPVMVDNDVNAMALGHMAAGTHEDAVYVLVSTGIGAGLLSHGHLHRGAQGAAGDMGHTHINGYDTVVCRCGRIGCLEAIAGGWALERSAHKVAANGLSPYLAEIKETHGHITVADLVSGVNSGDTSCTELIVMAATTIGSVLAVLVSLFNPARIILAGTVPEECTLFIETVTRAINEHALTLATTHLAIEVADSPEDDGTRGCAHMVVDDVFDRATSLNRMSSHSTWSTHD